MSKDRAAPFSRKHRRYWLTVTGGMLLIGALNVALGMCSYEEPPARFEKMDLVIPPRSGPPPATPRFVPETVAPGTPVDAREAPERQSGQR